MLAHLPLYTLSTLFLVCCCYTEAFTIPLSGNNNHNVRQVHGSTLSLKQNPSWGLLDTPHTHRTKCTALSAASLSEGEGTPSSYKDNNYESEGKVEDEEEEEWEYEEYEQLSESDFYGSEWKVGTLMEGSKSIDETWCRCAVKDGQFIAVWGDGSDGRWNFDAASQFFSVTKESFGGWFGKKIWAGTVDDYYFMEGTVRGWSPIQPASVIGQWQMKRLGVDPEEAGVAPWFLRDDEGGESQDDKDSSSQESS
jgi:hypothetical protein